MTTFLLIRHGHTDAVDAYLAGRQRGTPLTSRGLEQVRALVERLRHVQVDAVVSSPLTRTRETAEALAGDRGLSVEVCSALDEFDFGDWTGRAFSEVDADPRWSAFNAVRSVTRAPGGEGMLGVQSRAVAALLDLACRYPTQTVAIVSHGDVIRAIVMYCLGIPIDFVHRLEISPARLTIVTVGQGQPPVVRQVNADSAPGEA
jgi:broad specificity phosphatase PhoE